MPGAATHLAASSTTTSRAVRHATSAFELSISRSAREVRIEVADEGAGAPEQQVHGIEAPSGRGLQIVEALSDDWGVAGSARRRTNRSVLLAGMPGGGETARALLAEASTIATSTGHPGLIASVEAEQQRVQRCPGA